MSATPISPKEGFFRRNGKPQSCEPCRKSKVRCDHTFPTCLRCRARNAGAQCVYHPAPLTRPRSQYRRFRPDGASLSSLDNGGLPSTMDFGGDGDAASGTSPDSELVTPMSSEGGDIGYHLEQSHFEKFGYGQKADPTRFNGGIPVCPSTAPPAASRSNFLGSTSYSSVFSHSWQNGTAGSGKQWQTPLSNMDIIEDTLIDPGNVINGARILELFTRIPDLETSIKRFYQIRHFVFIPEMIILNSVVSIKATLAGGHSKATSHLQNLSKAVFVNTSRPLDFSHTTNPKLIHEMITGPHLRWEILGIIFTLAGLSSQAMSEEIPKGEYRSREEFIREMANASETILGFCDAQEQVNDLVAWYQYESFLLQAGLHGDTSNFAWRRLGDLATTIYALGMHHSTPSSSINSDSVSVFFRESRKKCFSAAYTLDKAIATLLGRPPRISNQYSTQTIPLNLSDEETMAEGEQMTINLGKLDVDGWNRDGVIRCCSWIRTRTMVAQVREEVLLLSLGRGVMDIEARALDAITRSQNMWASIPPLMKYTPTTFSTRSSAKESYMLLAIYLEHLYSTFLLHRILSKHTGTDSSDLYESAWALLSTTLTLCRERDRLQGIQNQLSWTVVYNGLPSAGLLALELLRTTQSHGSYQSHLLIPRAELIRSLSVFIDALEWVARPEQGNHALCIASKKVLTQILDAVLDPQSYRDPPNYIMGTGRIMGNRDMDSSVSVGLSAGSPSEDSAVGLSNGSIGHKDSWDGGAMVSGAGGGIGEWEARLMSMEVGMESAGTIDWDAWIST